LTLEATMQAPDFWQRGKGGLNALMLAPFGWLYGAVVHSRFLIAQPWVSPIPVICIGNLVAGGAGKTPVAMSIARRLMESGAVPHFLSRGYGGSATHPLRVDPARHKVQDTGDEALLLARIAPTWKSPDRPSGCRAAIEAGATAIVMDDGFQNPSVAKTLSLLVIDGAYGFGNGHVLPAGPLREPIADGLSRADAVVVMGKDEAGIEDTVRRLDPSIPILRARLQATDEAKALKGKAVVAFAGIGRPDKFLATLGAIGCEVKAFHAFPDHYPYSETDIARIAAEAEKLNALAVTTEKDLVRVPETLRARISGVGAEVVWRDREALDALLQRIAGNGS